MKRFNSPELERYFQPTLFNVNDYNIKKNDILSLSVGEDNFFIVSSMSENSLYCWGFMFNERSYGHYSIEYLISEGYRKYQHPLIEILKEVNIDPVKIIGSCESFVSDWLKARRRIVRSLNKKHISDSEFFSCQIEVNQKLKDSLVLFFQQES